MENLAVSSVGAFNDSRSAPTSTTGPKIITVAVAVPRRNSIGKSSSSSTSKRMSNSNKSNQSSEFNGSDIDILDEIAINAENQQNEDTTALNTSNNSTPRSKWLSSSNVNVMTVSKNKNSKSLLLKKKSSHVSINSNNSSKGRYNSKLRHQPEILSMLRDIVSKSGSIDLQENMKYLCGHAPHLDNRQAVMMTSCLLSDCARTIIVSLVLISINIISFYILYYLICIYIQLGISVLVKHSWSGKDINSISYIEKVLGGPICQIIGTTLLNDLLLWLKSNRRTPATFKHANQTHMEIGKFFLSYIVIDYFFKIIFYDCFDVF